jgi:hypothetical protein
LSQKIEPADINLKISTKNGPQKLFDIKIRTPGRPYDFQTPQTQIRD